MCDTSPTETSSEYSSINSYSKPSVSRIWIASTIDFLDKSLISIKLGPAEITKSTVESGLIFVPAIGF